MVDSESLFPIFAGTIRKEVKLFPECFFESQKREAYDQVIWLSGRFAEVRLFTNEIIPPYAESFMVKTFFPFPVEPDFALINDWASLAETAPNFKQVLRLNKSRKSFDGI
jgi:hypothetical protein